MPSVVTSGVWTDIVPQPTHLEGSGSAHLRWGQPVGDKRSGYRFEGQKTEAPLDGTRFKLGTFHHENFPITGVSQYSTIRLRVDVAFENNSFAQSFEFDFRHNETPNDGPSPGDEVDLPRLHSAEDVVIDGKEYVLVVEGFQQTDGPRRKFVSPENGANAADLVAKLVPASELQLLALAAQLLSESRRPAVPVRRCVPRRPRSQAAPGAPPPVVQPRS